MNQLPKNTDKPQVLYQGRWVDKDNFRVFVFNATDKKLVNSYEEYSDLIESGLWFSSIEEIKPKQPINIRSGRKAKNGADS